MFMRFQSIGEALKNIDKKERFFTPSNR